MSDPTRVTVNLTGRSLADLDATAERTNKTRTDTIHQAIAVYTRLAEAVETGSGAHRMTINGTKCVLLVGGTWMRETA
jgi:hypothetical protein